MKFLADMGVSPRCVEWLRSRGHDAVHLNEQGLHALPDREVLGKAISESRILLTMDLDFTQLASAGAGDLPIVVIFRLSDQRPQSVQARLEAILPVLEGKAAQGQAIISVGDERIRIRQLPIQ